MNRIDYLYSRKPWRIGFTFGFTEPGLPVIPSAVMWQNVQAGLATATQNGTLTSGATTCTGMTATNGLTVGMPITGTGIAPGTTIAAIVSSTAITLSLAATASGAQALTFFISDPLQSIWAGGNTTQMPSPPAPNIATDAPDCAFNIPDAQVLATTATYVPSPGRGLVVCVAGTTTGPTLQYNINGTWTTIFTFTAAATTATYAMFDGVNVRLNNLAATSSTFTIYRERSSKSTSI